MVNLLRDPHGGHDEGGSSEDPRTGRPTTASCRGLGRADPYPEITKYPHRHSHHRLEAAFATLDCFDGVHFAPRATVPAPFSVGLRAPACLPSTGYAAHSHDAGQDRTMTVWPFADRDGGCGFGFGFGRGSNPPTRLAWPHRRGLAPEL
ncbi:acetylxylan esterase [Streptomyces lateritius]|uniref:Acetylxylan esterase n=1 Tax=Streptomyces lateritius TaxID=67313 RepID=A0ABW6YJR1_9ACTN